MSGLLFANPITIASAPLQETVRIQVQEPTIPAVLTRVSWCESRNRQYNLDGTVLISRTGDYGYYQINQVHLPETKKLGMDIRTKKGNEAFALLLYKRRGTGDWYPSKWCWGDPLVFARIKAKSSGS